MQPAIEVHHLTKRYGQREVVSDLTFDVEEGEFFAILGPNGAGKTTTVEILEGYRRPDSGTVRVLGLDPFRESRQLRPRIGVMLQEGGLYPSARPMELLELYAAFYSDPESPTALVSRLGLKETLATPVRRLSGGQRQRLSLALALIGKPRVLFLDEPTAGMDPHARRETWDILRQLSAEKRTIVLTTHYLEEAEQLAHRVAIIHHGRLVALDSPSDLVAGSMGFFRFRTSGPLYGDGFPLPIEPLEDGWYAVRCAATPERILLLAEELARRDLLLLELRSGAESLEAAYLALTGGVRGG